MFLKLVNPIITLHPFNGVPVIDQHEGDEVVFIAHTEISVIRSNPTKKTYTFYLKNHHKFNCFESHSDQWSELMKEKRFKWF